MNEALSEICRQRRLTGEDLDELVHEAAAQEVLPRLNEKPDDDIQEAILEEAGKAAAGINNGGVDAQISYLVKQYGFEGAKHLLQTS